MTTSFTVSLLTTPLCLQDSDIEQKHSKTLINMGRDFDIDD